jgi:hypothetical protein
MVLTAEPMYVLLHDAVNLQVCGRRQLTAHFARANPACHHFLCPYAAEAETEIAMAQISFRSESLDVGYNHWEFIKKVYQEPITFIGK